MNAFGEINFMVKSAQVLFGTDGKTFTLKRGQQLKDVVGAWNLKNPHMKIDVKDILEANPGVSDTAYIAGKTYKLPLRSIGASPNVGNSGSVKPVSAMKIKTDLANRPNHAESAKARPVQRVGRVGGSGGAQSTEWNSTPPEKPSWHQYGVSHTCVDCGREFYKPNPKWSPGEIRHYNKEQKKMIDLHNRVMHGG